MASAAAPEHLARPPAARAATASRYSRGPSWIAVWALGIVVLLLVAGVAEWGILAYPATAPTPIVGPPGWTTFRESALPAQGMADRVPGGPWALAFGQGVASTQPWSPALSGTWGPTPACAARLAGLSLFTYWNASAYPKSSGATVFTSGTAPLWTFGYRNPLGDTLVLSDVNGSIGYNGVWPSTSGCAGPLDPGYDLGFSPDSVLDSPQVAQSMLRTPSGALQQATPFPPLDPRNPGSAFEMYSVGVWVSGAQGYLYGESTIGNRTPSWWVSYGACGLRGASGVVPGVVALVDPSTGTFLGSVGQWTQTCSAVGLNGSFGASALTTLPSAQGSVQSWILNLRPETSASPAPKNWNLVTTDSIRPYLAANSSPEKFPFDTVVPSGTATCTVTAKTISDCFPTSTGWYVVLTDGQGNWLDSFPSAGGGSNWTVSGVPVHSGDELKLLLALETPSVKQLALEYPGPEYVVGLGYVNL
ncbi:MAG: hypothetical protein L3J73_00650 [Thermoplasmata archaeon]|nr:hypothetical protein [Thermoplasmata archaeon]